jgi:hypothetical protein
MKSCAIRFDRVANHGVARRSTRLMPNSNSETSIANITAAAIAKRVGDCARRGIPRYTATAENIAKTEKTILSGAYRQITRLENDELISLDCWRKASIANITIVAIAKSIGIGSRRGVPKYGATAEHIAMTKKTLSGASNPKTRLENDEFISLDYGLDVDP